MDTLEAIKGRRSIRDFTAEPISKGILTEILDAARWAPTASNQQRWRFIVVTDPKVKEMVRKVSPGIFAMPAAFIVICVEKAAHATPWDEWGYAADCGTAAENMMLAAFALGVGSCPVLSFAKEAIGEILETPQGVEPLLIITLGYFRTLPEPPARLPLSRIAYADRYGKEWRA